MCNAQLCDGDDPSPPPHHCNTATLRSGGQFAGLWQQLQNFRHRIVKADPRRPTPAGLSVDEVAPVGCVPQPTTCGALLSRPRLRGEFAERHLLFPRCHCTVAAAQCNTANAPAAAFSVRGDTGQLHQRPSDAIPGTQKTALTARSFCLRSLIEI